MPIFGKVNRRLLDDWTLVDYPPTPRSQREEALELDSSSITTELPQAVDVFTQLLYEALDFPNYGTRFLKIIPLREGEHPSATISCELHHGSLIDGKAPRYVALSYCWGDHSKTMPILVNGCERRVTTNLEAALRELRSERVELVWVDAVCINQADNYERSYQVSRMGLIYSQAYKVVAWLGEAKEESDKAITTIDKASKRTGQDQLTDTVIYNTQYAIGKLLSRPYWSRAWIVQEVAKAPTVALWCGKARISWKSFARGCRECCRVYRSSLDDNIVKLTYFCDAESMSKRGAPRMPLVEALLQTRYTHATDERDRLYALLALTRDGYEALRTPNYEQSAAEVFAAVSRFMIATQGQIALVLLAGQRLNRPDLPSWLPLWANHGLSDIPPWILSTVSQAEHSFNYEPRAEGCMLLLQGTLLGKVENDISQIDPSQPSKQRINDAEAVMVHIANTIAMCAEDQPITSYEYEKARADAIVAWWITGKGPVLSRLMNWYETHRTMVIYGQTIEAWVTDWNSKRAKSSNYRRRIEEAHVTDYWAKILKPLDVSLSCMEKYELKMVISSQKLHVVHKATRPGDRIYRLRDCKMPVILRPVDQRWRVVGECVERPAEEKGSHRGARKQQVETKKWQRLTII